jgi:hypothetical protein
MTESNNRQWILNRLVATAARRGNDLDWVDPRFARFS